MAEQQDLESGNEQQELAELQLVELGRGEVRDDNQLFPFAGNMNSELLEAIKGVKSGVIIEQHITNVSGDVVKGNITNIKDANIRKVGDGDEMYSERQDHSKTSEYQQDIDEGDQIEEGYGTYGEQSRSQRGISSGGARRKIKQNVAETQEPWMFDSYAQTDEIQIRTVRIQTFKKDTFNTEVQTDDIVTRDRQLQTDSKELFDSDTQTSTKKNSDNYRKSASLQADFYTQTENIVLTNSNVQTDELEMTTNQTQTLIKRCQENEVQTENVATATTNTQTSDNTESALKLIEMYNNEHSKQKIDEFLPLLTIVWKSIQLQILLNFREQSFLDEIEDEVLSKFIQRVEKVFKLGQKFKEENNAIHSIVAFYPAAKLHKLKNKGNESVEGIMKCVYNIQLVIDNNMQQLQKRVANHVIPLMHDCVTELSNIKNANPHYVVICKAWCLFNIGLCYSYCKEYQQFAEMNTTATDMLYDHFEESANKFQIYGRCLNNAGVGFGRMNKNEKAVEYSKMALKAHEKTEDWTNDDEKKDLIALTENNLKSAQAKQRN